MKASAVVGELVSIARAAKTARATDTNADGGLKTLAVEEKRLGDFVHSQPPSLIFLLTAIAYLGRGDFRSRDEFLDYYADVGELFGSAKAAERQLLAKEPLADYLREGLRKLQEFGLDVDNLPT